MEGFDRTTFEWPAVCCRWGVTTWLFVATATVALTKEVHVVVGEVRAMVAACFLGWLDVGVGQPGWCWRE